MGFMPWVAHAVFVVTILIVISNVVYGSSNSSTSAGSSTESASVQSLAPYNHNNSRDNKIWKV